MAMLFTRYAMLILTYLGLRLVSGQSEPYVYVVYYEDEECSGGAVSMIGFSSEDDEIIFGGKSESGLCAHESICLVDMDSEQCQDLERTTTGNMTFSIGDEGLIFQCDDTNPDGECSVLDRCYMSSVYPNCHFTVELTSALIENPEKIENSHTTALDQQSYLLFYSDDECTNFEGMQSMASGRTELAVTDETISCQEAMSCLFHPTGRACLEVTNGLPPPTTQLFVETRNDGRDVFKCDNDEESCEQQSPETCMPSPIHRSCSFRWASARQLLEEPSNYLTSPLPVATEEVETETTAFKPPRTSSVLAAQAVVSSMLAFFGVVMLM